jgi:hypothetical protein
VGEKRRYDKAASAGMPMRHCPDAATRFLGSRHAQVELHRAATCRMGGVLSKLRGLKTAVTV